MFAGRLLAASLQSTCDLARAANLLSAPAGVSGSSSLHPLRHDRRSDKGRSPRATVDSVRPPPLPLSFLRQIDANPSQGEDRSEEATTTHIHRRDSAW